MHHMLPFDDLVLAFLALGFLGVFVMFLACMVLDYVAERSEQIKAFDWINRFLRMLGSITLETYLLHIIIRDIAGQPYALPGYILFGCVLPVVSGYILHRAIEMGFKK